MGITEYFRENPPGEKDLNIHDIVIEKDEKKREELLFDPEIEISNSDWQGMKAHLDLYRSQGNWGNFSWQAMSMKILSAHKVEVTNEGLDVTMRKPETFRPEKKTPRPERRQF